MRCRIELTVASDRPYLVRPEAFMKCVDEWDLACRESANIRDAYLEGWFRRKGHDLLFNPPAFYLKHGTARFINGRHRTVLLFRHSKLVPMSLTNMDAESADALANFVERELADDEFVELPELPIMPASYFGSR